MKNFLIVFMLACASVVMAQQPSGGISNAPAQLVVTPPPAAAAKPPVVVVPVPTPAEEAVRTYSRVVLTAVQKEVPKVWIWPEEKLSTDVTELVAKWEKEPGVHVYPVGISSGRWNPMMPVAISTYKRFGAIVPEVSLKWEGTVLVIVLRPEPTRTAPWRKGWRGVTLKLGAKSNDQKYFDDVLGPKLVEMNTNLNINDPSTLANLTAAVAQVQNKSKAADEQSVNRQLQRYDDMLNGRQVRKKKNRN